MKKQKIIISLCIIIAILIICIIIKIDPISQIRIYRKSAGLEMNENVLSYIMYDNTGEKLKTVVIISKEEGITSIEYIDMDGKLIKVNGNGKKKIAIDIKAEVNKDINFKVTSNNKETIEVMNIPSNYINKYISISKSEETSTDTIFNYNVEYNTDLSEDEEVKYYYKIGENNKTWVEYTGGQIGITISDVDNFEEKTTTFMLKEQNKYGDIIIRSETIDVPVIGDMDVFRNSIVMDKTLAEYGFTSSYSNSEDNAFRPYCLQAGHHKDYASWSGNFFLYLDPVGLNKLNASGLYIEYILYANTVRVYETKWRWDDYVSNVGFSTNLMYKDGISQNISRGQTNYESATSVPIEFTFDSEKEVNYVQMNISGIDNNYSSSYGYVKNIILRNAHL